MWTAAAALADAGVLRLLLFITTLSCPVWFMGVTHPGLHLLQNKY